MARKRGYEGLGAFIAAGSWIASALLVQATAGIDLGAAGRQLERRIEQHLREGSVPALATPPAVPARSHDDAIEPWELVSV